MVRNDRTALVVGASRGIGLGLVTTLLERGWSVTATSRGGATELDALASRHHGRLTLERVDVTDAIGVDALRDRLLDRLGEARLDLVLVNAGVTHDRWETVGEVSDETLCRLMVTNALAPVRFVERYADLVAADGTLAVTSSGQGSIANNTRVTGWEIYRASKAALNQLMRSYAARHADDTRTLLLLAPDWVRTELGGPDAPYSVEQSAEGLVDVVESQSGAGRLQFLDLHGETVAW